MIFHDFPCFFPFLSRFGAYIKPIALFGARFGAYIKPIDPVLGLSRKQNLVERWSVTTSWAGKSDCPCEALANSWADHCMPSREIPGKAITKDKQNKTSKTRKTIFLLSGCVVVCCICNGCKGFRMASVLQICSGSIWLEPKNGVYRPDVGPKKGPTGFIQAQKRDIQRKKKTAKLIRRFCVFLINKTLEKNQANIDILGEIGYLISQLLKLVT